MANVGKERGNTKAEAAKECEGLTGKLRLRNGLGTVSNEESADWHAYVGPMCTNFAHMGRLLSVGG